MTVTQFLRHEHRTFGTWLELQLTHYSRDVHRVVLVVAAPAEAPYAATVRARQTLRAGATPARLCSFAQDNSMSWPHKRSKQIPAVAAKH